MTDLGYMKNKIKQYENDYGYRDKKHILYIIKLYKNKLI